MAKPILFMSHLTEQIEAPQPLRNVGTGKVHTQAKPQPVTVTLCASCQHQSADNFDVCNQASCEGGPVGGRFVMWAWSGWEAKTE